MRAGYIKDEPAWYKAVLNHPPLPLPAKAPAARSSYDKPSENTSTGKMRAFSRIPLPIYYLEDDIRRQFFRDHPFEAFRPTTLVERGGIRDEHPIRGKEWTRLRQRGRNPTAEESVFFLIYPSDGLSSLNLFHNSAVRFALNLYQHHDLPLSEAYKQAIYQFRSLRSEHYIATRHAVTEARYLGATFLPTEIQHAYNKEVRNMDTWQRKEENDEAALTASKRWKANVERQQGINQWTKGEEYVRLWKEGIQPDYSPALTEPITQN